MSIDPNFLANLDPRLHPEAFEGANDISPAALAESHTGGVYREVPSGELPDHHVEYTHTNITSDGGGTSTGALPVYDVFGQLSQPVSAQFDGLLGASLDHASVPATDTPLPPSPPASIPSMTEGASPSPSSGPVTPSIGAITGVHALPSPPMPFTATSVQVPPTSAAYMHWLFSNIMPCLTVDQNAAFRKLWEQGRAPPPQVLINWALANGMDPAVLSTAPPPPMDPTMSVAPITNPTHLSYRDESVHAHAHTHATHGVQRTVRTRAHASHEPYTMITTYQGVATGVALRHNNNRSTGATLEGGAQSSGASGPPSSRPRSTKKAKRREDDDLWHNPTLKFTLAEDQALNSMYADKGESAASRTCVFPGCSEGLLRTRQARNRHAQSVHLKTLGYKCDICTDEHPQKKVKIIQRKDGYERHMRKAHGNKADAEEEGNEGEPEDGTSEAPAVPKDWRKDGDDDADVGGAGEMSTSRPFATLQV